MALRTPKISEGALILAALPCPPSLPVILVIMGFPWCKGRDLRQAKEGVSGPTSNQGEDPE